MAICAEKLPYHIIKLVWMVVFSSNYCFSFCWSPHWSCSIENKTAPAPLVLQNFHFYFLVLQNFHSNFEIFESFSAWRHVQPLTINDQSKWIWQKLLTKYKSFLSCQIPTQICLRWKVYDGRGIWKLGLKYDRTNSKTKTLVYQLFEQRNVAVNCHSSPELY